MTYFFLFIFGLTAGSFLNVVSLRYEPGRKLYIGGRSRCLYCGKELVWHELIPLVSFFVQKGKCRACGQKLSFQYPLVEFLSGLIFIFVPFALYNLFIIHDSLFIIQVFLWILIFLLFLLFSAIDFRLYIIPDFINLLLAVLGITLIISNFQRSFLGHYSLLFGSINNIWLNHFFAAFAAMAFFAVIIIVTSGRAMGWGDFKLAGALGLIFGWPDALMIVFFSFIVGAIFVTPLLIGKKKTMKDVVPFGPFLAIGAGLVFFLGYNIIDGYFKIFKLF